MDTKEDGESPDDRTQQWYEDAMGEEEASDSVNNGGSGIPPKVPPHGHRRCQSELATGGLPRSDSYHKLKSHVQKAWRWGNKSREEISPLTFNPEVLANQKRQWYQLNSKTLVFIQFYFALLICFLCMACASIERVDIS